MGVVQRTNAVELDTDDDGGDADGTLLLLSVFSKLPLPPVFLYVDELLLCWYWYW